MWVSILAFAIAFAIFLNVAAVMMTVKSAKVGSQSEPKTGSILAVKRGLKSAGKNAMSDRRKFPATKIHRMNRIGRLSLLPLWSLRAQDAMSAFGTKRSFGRSLGAPRSVWSARTHKKMPRRVRSSEGRIQEG
jgi:hypothetical protein